VDDRAGETATGEAANDNPQWVTRCFLSDEFYARVMQRTQQNRKRRPVEQWNVDEPEQ
jgi:hypothetical protein